MTTNNNFKVKNGINLGEQGITFSDNTVQTTAYTGGGAFDQTLDTTSSVQFNNIDITNNNVGQAGAITSPNYLNVVTTSTQDIDLYTNNWTSNGVEVWLRHNDGVEINTANGGKSWKFFPDGHTRFATIMAADTTATTTGSGLLAMIEDAGCRLAYYSTTACNWLFVGTEAVVYTPPPPPPGPVAGYIAWYDASSFAGSSWNDLSGNGYDATVTGTPTVTSVSGSGGGTFDAVVGTASDVINWPMSMPTDFTLFIVSRYNGSSKERIYTNLDFTSAGCLYGHHSNKSGVVYFRGATNTWMDYYGSNWVISSVQNDPLLYNANGTNYPITGSADGPTTYPLTINGRGGEQSDFATAEVIIYDSILSSGDIATVEAYLATKYSITI